MRKLIMTVAIAMVSAAACSATDQAPTSTDSSSETATSQSPSADSSGDSDSQAEAETESEENLDIFNHSLDGLPDCMLEDFDVVDAGNGEIVPGFLITDDSGVTYNWETQIILGQTSGRDCVIREPVSMRLENSNGEIQWPVFAKTVVEYELPWAIDAESGFRLFYQEDKDLYPCAADDVYVDTIIFSTESQGTLEKEFGHGLFVCPYKVEGYHSDLYMEYAQ